jgi:hypothetical protein
MAGYRDELEAMAARTEALQKELQDREREVEELRGKVSPEERLDKLARDLAAAQAELASLRGPRSPTQRTALFAVALGSSLLFVGLGLAAFLGTRHSSSLTVPTAPASRPVEVAPVEAPLPPPAPTARTRTPPPPPEDPPRTLDTTWKGRVRKARGSDMAIGAPCEVRATLSSRRREPDPFEGRQPSGTRDVAKLVVLCGTVRLYSTEDHFNGESMTSSSVYEQPARAGGFQRSLVYEDSGSRQGRNDVSIDTNAGVARVWSGGAKPIELELAVDELDAPVPDALLETSPAGEGCPSSRRAGSVTAAKGSASVKTGAQCLVVERPRDGRCQVNVACGGKVLYPNGFADVNGGIVIDDKPSTEDRDPKLRIAGNQVVVSDEGLTNWSVEVRLVD